MIKSKTFVSFAIGASLFAGVISEARAENPLEFFLKLFAPKSQGAHRNQPDTTTPPIP